MKWACEPHDSRTDEPMTKREYEERPRKRIQHTRAERYNPHPQKRMRDGWELLQADGDDSGEDDDATR